MSALHLLWLFSLALAGASLAWMTLLIFGRIIRIWFDRRRSEARNTIQNLYLRILRGDSQAIGEVKHYCNKPVLLIDALLRVMDIVRGASRERLIQELACIGMEKMLRAHALRGSVNIRMAAIECFAAAFPTEENEKLMETLVDSSAPAEIRLAAARSLASIGVPVDVAALIHGISLRHEAWSALLGDLLKKVAEHQPEKCIALLQRHDLPTSVRAMAVGALGSASYYRVIPALRESASSNEPEIRSASLVALSRLMDPAVADLVERGCADPDWRVRAAAADAIATVGLQNLLSPLEELLADPVWLVRFRAAEALLKLGDSGISRLRHIAASNPNMASHAAALTLAENGLG